MRSTKIQKVRRVLGYVAILTFGISLILWVWLSHSDLCCTFIGGGGPDDSLWWYGLFTAIGTMITAIVSLLGFIVTTFYLHRQHQRKAVLAAIEIEQRELEIKKLNKELSDPESDIT